MNKLILSILYWFLLNAALSTDVRADPQQGRLTQDITVGASHDIHLKANQAVQVLNDSGPTAVIMVQLPDGSNGVYQIAGTAVQIARETASPTTSVVTDTATINAGFVNNGADSQTEESNTVPSMNDLPQGIALIVDTVPMALKGNKTSDAKLEVDSLLSGTLINPIDIINGSFVINVKGHKLTKEQIEGDNGLSINLQNPFSESSAGSGAHFVEQTEDWSGTALIPIKNTNYSQLIATKQTTLTQNSVNTPAPIPSAQDNSFSPADGSSGSRNSAVQPQASATQTNSLSMTLARSDTASNSATNFIGTPLPRVTATNKIQLAQADDHQRLVNANLAVFDGQNLLVNGFYDEAANRFQYAADATTSRRGGTFVYNRAEAGLAAAKAGQAQKLAYETKFAQASTLLQQAITLQPDSLVYKEDIQEMKKWEQSYENDIHGPNDTVNNTNNAGTDNLKIKGIIILKACAAYEAANIPFVSIQWVNNDGGFVMDTTGTRTPFLNEAVREIVYYDHSYFEQINGRGDWFVARFGLKDDEITVDMANLQHITFSDLDKLQTEEKALEGAAQTYFSASALFQPAIKELKDDISRVSSGQIFQNGKWFTKEELAALPPPPSIGRFVKLITLIAPNKAQYTNVIVDGTLEASGTLNEKQYTQIAPLTLSNASDIVNKNGGTAIFSSVDSDFPFVDCDLTGLSQEVLERVADARLEALFNYANNGSNTAPVYIGEPLINPKDNDINSNSLEVFVKAVELLGRQSRSILPVQKELSEDVLNVLMKSLPDPNNRALILNEWPDLKKSISFTSQQQIDVYTFLIEQENLSISECTDVLNLTNAPDSPPEVKSFIAKWTDQIASANKLDAQMEEALAAFFSDPANKTVLQKPETKEELGKTLNLGSSGDAIVKDMQTQLSQTNLPCVTSELQTYVHLWSQLKLIPQLRDALAGGKLKDAESLASMLSPDSNIPIDLTSGQKQAADACATNVSLYESQKKEAQDLLDNAERLRSVGGQRGKALQDYKDAYQLNSDPSILQKIKDLNNESLGI